MESILAFFFWVILIILAVRMLVKYLLPYLLKRKLEKMMGGKNGENSFVNLSKKVKEITK